MTLIFPDNNSSAPSTYAFVIGVGGYRHLLDGEDPHPAVLERVGRLGQLTSPPRSAIEFAKFLLTVKDRLRAPLGSLEMLISPTPSEPNIVPNDMAADHATIDKIREAYVNWRARCDRNKDNIAIFYFCGHGVEENEQYLLAEDFGENALSPWLGSFAFDSTRRAFNDCRTETQCFFVDACRKIPAELLLTRPTGIPLEDPGARVSECRYDLTIKAAARNESAFSAPSKPSYFVQALIKALTGSASEQDENGATWSVNTGKIASSINTVMGMVKTSEGTRQRCKPIITELTKLVTIEGTPTVPFTISCNPKAANRVVKLSSMHMTWPLPAAVLRKRAPWKREVFPGNYHTEAVFDAGDFRNTQQEFNVIPPICIAILEC